MDINSKSTKEIEITESNLSRTPPCPGIIFPKSLIPEALLMAEKSKSPITATIPQTSPHIAIKKYEEISN